MPEYDVFLSYARDDSEDAQLNVDRLAEAIQEQFVRIAGSRARLFIDKSSIRFGDAWENNIMTALDSSKVLLACVSPRYLQSSWCLKEWRAFANRESAVGQKILFPVRLAPLDRLINPSHDAVAIREDSKRRQSPDAKDLFLEGSSALPALVEAMLDAMDPSVSIRPPEEWTQPLIWRLGTNRRAFENWLVRSVKVTIVGLTNQHLAAILRVALHRKTQEYEAPWTHVEIVFLGQQLLGCIDDEYSSSENATQERAKFAQNARHDLARLLEHVLGDSGTWSLREYPYLLPFIGALFELADGRKVVQLGHLLPGRPSGEALFFEFNSFLQPTLTAHYESTFFKIVEKSSISDEKIVVGRPGDDDGFVISGFRPRSEIWKGHAFDTIAAVIAVLWQRGSDGSAQPLLQVRTPENSRRELGYLSNLSGFINFSDCEQKVSGTLTPDDERRAVNREVSEELNQPEVVWNEPVRIMSVPYHFADDRESFMFFLYSVELKRGGIRSLPIPGKVGLKSWTIKKLIEIRRMQMLRLTADAISKCRSADGLRNMFDLARYNLLLHEEDDLAHLAHDLADALKNRSGIDKEPLVRRLRERLESGQQFIYRDERPILGLAGLQYREFFSKLIPAYAELGVPDAEECLRRTKGDAAALAALYQDVHFVRTVQYGLDGLHEASHP